VLSLAAWKHGLIVATYMLDNRGGNKRIIGGGAIVSVKARRCGFTIRHVCLGYPRGHNADLPSLLARQLPWSRTADEGLGPKPRHAVDRGPVKRSKHVSAACLLFTLVANLSHVATRAGQLVGRISRRLTTSTKEVTTVGVMLVMKTSSLPLTNCVQALIYSSHFAWPSTG
jgi:hypothetical protein